MDRHEWLARMMPALMLCVPASLLYWMWWLQDRKAARQKKLEGFEVKVGKKD